MPGSHDNFLQYFGEKLLAGQIPVLDHDVLLESGKGKAEAMSLVAMYEAALASVNVTGRVFGRHIGAGCGWGVYAGPKPPGK